MNRRLLFLLPLISGCIAPAEPPHPSAIRETARIANPAITEASGLARSHLRQDRLWLINDGGAPPVVHAIGIDGRTAGSVTLDPGANIDWEAMASFELDGTSWLLVADTGDNEAVREISMIYVVEEPLLGRGEHVVRAPAWTIPFRWPGGPRDCEAVAVDAAAERILLLSKRTIPAMLYQLPLRPPSAGVLLAMPLGALDSLPQPTAGDLQRAAPEQNWHWQPTAMDITRDSSAAVILTYRALYHFERPANVPWMEAFRKPPARLGLGDIREAEAVAFGDNNHAILLTGEGSRAPLYRVEAIPRGWETR